MYKIGIIGDRASVSGFMALGFSVFEVSDVSEAKEALRHAAAGGEFAALFLTEELAERMQEELDRYKDMPLPAVTVIPGASGTKGFGLANLKKATERAIGADILFNNEKE